MRVFQASIRSLAFRPMMHLILQFDTPEVKGISYFVTDICVTLLSWSAAAIPDSADAFLAGRVLRFLVTHARNPSGVILRNNINIIKIMVEKWRLACLFEP